MKLPHDASRPWRFLYALLTVLKWAVCRLTVEGTENVPYTGGCIITCNHTAGPDYIFLGYGSPRQIYYMAKAEIFRVHPWVSKFFMAFGVFPIRRGQGDLGAIEHAVQIVKGGRVLGMFPEGTRSWTGELKQGKTGVVRIAMMSGVPVVPAVVIGSLQAQRRIGQFWRRPQVIVRFGQPRYFTGDPMDKEVTQAAIDEVMLAMATMLPENMRGEWGKLVQN